MAPKYGLRRAFSFSESLKKKYLYENEEPNNMTSYTTTWNKEELTAYLLIYCANADFIESNDEKALIKSKTTDGISKRMHVEFEQDNDFDSIQKIESTLLRLKYTNEEKGQLLDEMKEMFLLDGNYDLQEMNLFRGLKRILG